MPSLTPAPLQHRFDIPVYQRAYSWDTKQIFDMVSDFHKAYVSRSEYFLGAIVTVRASGSTALPSYEIIDGQQRLTSLFILLAALHDWAKEEGNDVLQQRCEGKRPADYIVKPFKSNPNANFGAGSGG